MPTLKRKIKYPANDERSLGIQPLGHQVAASYVWKKRTALSILAIFLLFTGRVVSEFWTDITDKNEGVFDIVLSEPAPEETLIEAVSPNAISSSGLQVVLEEAPFYGASGDNKADARELAKMARQTMGLGKTSKALRYERHALKLDPSNMLYRLELAIMYDHADEKDKAIDLYLDVIEAYENDDKTLPLDLDIDPIRRRMEFLVTAAR